MAEAFIGEIRPFGFGFAPVNWLPCSGQLLPIASNTALFSILGTNFGGDGRVTFGLPNFNGAIPVGAGVASTGTDYGVGGTGGEKTVMLTTATTPAHTHQMNGAGARYAADSNTPGPTATFAPASGCNPYVAASPAPPIAAMAPGALTPFGVGVNGPHNNMMPTLTVTMCICTSGIFPPRS